MYTLRDGGEIRSALDYENTITHEFGHLFGIDDGYGEENFENDSTLRPDATMLTADDVMFNNHRRRTHVTDIDIQMLLVAASTGEWQYYMEYAGNIPSVAAVTYERCEND